MAHKTNTSDRISRRPSSVGLELISKKLGSNSTISSQSDGDSNRAQWDLEKPRRNSTKDNRVASSTSETDSDISHSSEAKARKQ